MSNTNNSGKQAVRALLISFSDSCEQTTVCMQIPLPVAFTLSGFLTEPDLRNLIAHLNAEYRERQELSLINKTLNKQ
jgi:hypothetical protein